MRHWPKLVHLLALAPLVLLLWDAATNNLTANPIQAATQRTGLTALGLLIASLACTPLNTLFGWKQITRLRKPLGLYAFGYALLHMAMFMVIDYGLDRELIVQAIVEKQYVLAGLTAVLLLIPLAITSTKGWMRRLGQNWKRLHRLVYLAAPLAVLHFVWLVKADLRLPLAFAAVLAVLLVLRVPWLRQRLRKQPQMKAYQVGREPGAKNQKPMT